MDPKKLYEYLASGKPVITTDVSGVNEFKFIVKISKNKEEFSNYINLILDSEKENHKILKEERINSVKKYSWKTRVDEIMEIIKKI